MNEDWTPPGPEKMGLTAEREDATLGAARSRRVGAADQNGQETMLARSYLGGALTVEELGPDSGGGGLFRAEDARGGVAWLARGEPFSYLHALEFRSPGDRRGFHVHADYTERLYVFSGTVRMLAARDGERVEVLLTAGCLVTLAPGVAHGVIAETPAFAVGFGSGADPFSHSTPTPDLG